jgi:hypothetical protein
VHLAFGAHVHAPGGVVQEQDGRLCFQPRRKDGLLLIPAGQQDLPAPQAGQASVKAARPAVF